MYQEAMENVHGQISLTVRDIGDVIKHELKKAISREIASYLSPDKRAILSNNQNAGQTYSQVGSKSTRLRSTESKSEIQAGTNEPGKMTSG